MNRTTPQALLTELVESRGRGDIEAAMACYETGALIVTQPGESAAGTDAIRNALTNFAALHATFTVVDREFLEADGVASHLSSWTLGGLDSDGKELRVSGRSTDVARRQANGEWLLAIDNPWGAARANGSAKA